MVESSRGFLTRTTRSVASSRDMPKSRRKSSSESSIRSDETSSDSAGKISRICNVISGSVKGPEFHVVAPVDKPGSGDAFTDNDASGPMFVFLRDDEGIVGADNRVVVIAPESAPGRTHPPYFSNPVQVPDGNQIVAAGDRSLDDHLRRLLQDDGGFPLYGVGEKDDRSQHEDDERVDEEQRGVLPFPSEERREGEIEDIPLSFNQFSHKTASACEGA